MSRKIDTKLFVHEATGIHKNFYDYSKVIYKNSHVKIEIICPLHGTFIQYPYDHLQGRGCQKCGKSKKLTLQEFIERSTVKHNHKYDYSKSHYVNNCTKLIIICPRHGDFLQIPNDHLLGRGCRKCAYELNLNKTYSQSKSEIEFLNYQKVPNKIQYIGGYYVDGYDPIINTAYEFLGDYWHGNPEIFNPVAINKSLNKTYKELYDNTFIRFTNIKKYGYKIKYIWENDWKRFKKGMGQLPKISEY